MSSLTLPWRDRRPPTKSRIAAAIASGVARRRSERASADPGGRHRIAAVESSCIALAHLDSVAQGRQERDHVLDLLGGEDRLAAPGGPTRVEPFDPIVCRHDRVRVEAGWVDKAQPELTLGPARAGPGRIRREVALESLLRKRAGMAEQAQAPN